MIKPDYGRTPYVYAILIDPIPDDNYRYFKLEYGSIAGIEQ